MPTPRRRLTHTFSPELGQSLAEYSLLLALIFVAVAAALPAVGSAIGGLYDGAVGFFGS